MNKTAGRVVGPLGLLFILFALFSRIFLTGEFDGGTLLQLLLGLGGVAYWAVSAFDDARNVATGRGTVFVLASTVATALVLGALGALNWAAVKKDKEWDLTKGAIHSLADQTTELLKALTPEKKVTVTAFLQPLADGPAYDQLETLLKRFKAVAGDGLVYEFVDANKNPQRARELQITAESSRIVLKSASGREARAAEPTEESLANALASLSRGTDGNVYFVVAHGEHASAAPTSDPAGASLWAEALKDEGFRAQELSLLTTPEVPADAAVVVVAGPVQPFSDKERTALEAYAARGGRLLVMVDPGRVSGLEPLLASWGVTPLNGTVLDPAAGNPLVAIAQEFSEHPLARRRQNLPFLFPEARGVKASGSAGYELTEVFKTSARAWGETSPLTEGASMTRNEADDAGPVPLAVAVTRKLDGDKQLRALVVGDSDWATNGLFNQYGNRDLALNAVSWLAGNDQSITIRPRRREPSTLAALSKEQRNMLSVGALNVVPMLLIACGLSIWSVRRSR